MGLMDNAKDFANDHKDDAERMAREKMGKTNRQDQGDQNREGGSGMQDPKDENMRDADTGMQDDSRRDEYTDAA